MPMLSQRVALFGGGAAADVVVGSCGGVIGVVSTSSSSGWLGASLTDEEAERADAESRAPDIVYDGDKCNSRELGCYSS